MSTELHANGLIGMDGWTDGVRMLLRALTAPLWVIRRVGSKGVCRGSGLPPGLAPLGSLRCLSPAKSISPSSAQSPHTHTHTSAHTSGRHGRLMAPAARTEAIFKYVPVFLFQIAPG